MFNLATSVWRRICVLPNLVQDLIVYLLAAMFAGITGVVAGSADYRDWGLIALGPYLAAAVVSSIAISKNNRRQLALETLRRIRLLTVLFVCLTAVLTPLLAELSWRAHPTAPQAAHAQPEVAVIERAGDRVALGLNPYPAHPSDVGVSPTSDSHRVDSASYFPYLPGMAVFGLLNATTLPSELGDARVLFVFVAVVTFLWSLSLTRASPERKMRALQFFVALPVGALPMVTGGDDLPVIGLILMFLVLLQRRQALASGMVAALACSLKFTAWPIALLVFLATYRRDDRKVAREFALGFAFVVPVVLVGMYGNAHAFVENVIRFPLGLTTVKSPAASPLLGQFLVTIMPHHRRVVTLVLALIGLVIVGVAFVLRRPHDAAGVARFAAFALCVATVLAPATRFGYLIYPTLLFVWSYVLTGFDQPALDDVRAALG